jgi:hypothetical protein
VETPPSPKKRQPYCEIDDYLGLIDDSPQPEVNLEEQLLDPEYMYYLAESGVEPTPEEQREDESAAKERGQSVSLLDCL